MKSQDEADAKSKKSPRRLVWATFFNKHLEIVATDEAVGPQLNFTYAPKTFSRKFFMHFEGIEQLERKNGVLSDFQGRFCSENGATLPLCSSR